MERSKENNFGTRQIATTAVLLAICIVSQVFKNLSVLQTWKGMDKLLLSRNLTKLHDKYYAEKDKDKRMQASRVIPILEKAGIIE